MYSYASRLGAAAVALAAMASVASAQGARPMATSHPTFGIIAGGNFAKLSGDDAGDADRRTAFVGGGYVDLPLGTSGVSLQPRLLFSMSGAKYSNFGGAGIDGTLAMNYVRMPVLVRYTLPTSGGLRPFFSLGPSLGIQVSCKVNAGSGGVSASETCDQLNRDIGGGFEKKTFDLSGDFEFGLDFPLGRRSFSIGGIFSQGFTDTFKDTKTRNQSLTAFASFGF